MQEGRGYILNVRPTDRAMPIEVLDHYLPFEADRGQARTDGSFDITVAYRMRCQEMALHAINRCKEHGYRVVEVLEV